jgi:hypothetical protein
MDSATTSRAATVLSATVLRNLSDRAYDKRKAAALEIEAKVKVLCQRMNHEHSIVLSLESQNDDGHEQ